MTCAIVNEHVFCEINSKCESINKIRIVIVRRKIIYYDFSTYTLPIVLIVSLRLSLKGGDGLFSGHGLVEPFQDVFKVPWVKGSPAGTPFMFEKRENLLVPDPIKRGSVEGLRCRLGRVLLQLLAQWRRSELGLSTSA